LLVCDRSFYTLFRRCLRREECFLPCSLRASTLYVGLNCIDTGLGRGDLCFREIDSGEGSFDARILKFALPPVILYRSFGGFHRGACLCQLRLIIVILEFDKQVTSVDFLEV
jgi:hypothetical protein